MISIYPKQDDFKTAVWVDLLCPTKLEEKLVEKKLKIGIPTREEMREIEVSSRLYKENGNLFMTGTMLAQADSAEPKFDAISFVLTKHQLITIRYIEPQCFRLFTAQLQRQGTIYTEPSAVLIDLLDANVDRLADILEVVGHRLDEYSKTIFRPQDDTSTSEKLDHQQLLQQTGANGDLNSKSRESLLSFSRLISYFTQAMSAKLDAEANLRLISLSRDIASLIDHGNFLSNKVNFLLDATLGMVSIEQNKIIKIFSVAAVIFLPPTLIASIFGMNFHFMPELSWKGGYYLAIVLMILSAWLPYKFFKRKKWL